MSEESSLRNYSFGVAKDFVSLGENSDIHSVEVISVQTIRTCHEPSPLAEVVEGGEKSRAEFAVPLRIELGVPDVKGFIREKVERIVNSRLIFTDL